MLGPNFKVLYFLVCYFLIMFSGFKSTVLPCECLAGTLPNTTGCFLFLIVASCNNNLETSQGGGKGFGLKL